MADQTTDTNLVENEVAPGVLGRNYWLFSGNPQDAYTSAALYSLIETAKANDLEPYWNLRSILEKLPHASTEDDFCKLLPKNVPEPLPADAARPGSASSYPKRASSFSSCSVILVGSLSPNLAR